MALRDFAGPQLAVRARVEGSRELHWLELNCPRCCRLTYVPQRDKRLARIGSQQEYASCSWCGLGLTLGRLIVYPDGKGLLSKLAFWRRLRGGGTMESE